MRLREWNQWMQQVAVGRIATKARKEKRRKGRNGSELTCSMHVCMPPAAPTFQRWLRAAIEQLVRKRCVCDNFIFHVHASVAWYIGAGVRVCWASDRRVNQQLAGVFTVRPSVRLSVCLSRRRTTTSQTRHSHTQTDRLTTHATPITPCPTHHRSNGSSTTAAHWWCSHLASACEAALAMVAVATRPRWLHAWIPISVLL